MIYHYLNITIRSLLKTSVHSIINVAGLAFGIACVFLIILYLQHELSYDRFHHEAENLYRITWEDNNPQTRTPHPMAQAMKHDFAEVESAVSLTPLYAAGLTKETHSFRNPQQDTRYDEKNILAVDTTFFDVFSFPLVKGNAKEALNSVDGLLISESMARKYFGDEEPVGQHLAVDAEDHLLEVVGVFKDVPKNSHFHFDFLVSYLREKSFDREDPFYAWGDFGHYNYIRLKDGTDAQALEDKLLPWLRKYIHVSDDEYQAIVNQHFGFRLQKVTDIHLQSRLRWELEPNGNMEYVYMLSAAALLTLIIACVNFMNLTTAKSAERAKEIGVRKSLGATQRQLSFQFLAESVVMALLAILIAVLIIEIALPYFNALTGLSFAIHYRHHGVVLLLLGFFIGILSGLYPSFYLSGMKPHLIMKGKMIATPRGSTFRKGLIVFQFFMSMILVSAVIVISNQLDFLMSNPLGFEKEAVVVIPVKNESGMDRFESFQNELLKIEGIISVSAGSNIPGHQFNQHHIASLRFPDDDVPASEAFVDYDFFKTLDISLADGRTFVRDNPADTGAVFVLNETGAKQLNIEGSVVGSEILWKQNEENSVLRGTVIGIVKDFHFQSLHEPIRPLIFLLTHERFNYILIRLHPENLTQKIASIEEAYEVFEPVFGFEFSFLEDQLNDQYAAEKRTGNLLKTFTAIAILIAVLGLFGMSLLNFQQKSKALSIRKVLGASVTGILVLLIGDFTRLILFAVLLATPFAWWIMNDWLENFTYRISIHPLTFVVSGLILIAVCWATLSFFAVKALRLNPAETLKNE